MTTSIDIQEIEHFSKDSLQWWDETGPFAPLHKLNPVRISYILQQIESHYRISDNKTAPLKNLKILDVGSGGGLVCEPLARLGADVTGLDADKNAVGIAKAHAKTSKLDINYQHTSIEKHTGSYDVVLALEIIEHVSDIKGFTTSCAKLCKPGGLIIISTLNRTFKSFTLGIITAEYILNWVPKGTHQWKKFIKPSELAKELRQNDIKPVDIKGMNYNPLQSEFKMSDGNVNVNYFMSGVKK